MSNDIVTNKYEAPWIPSELDKTAEALIVEMEKEYVPTDPVEREPNLAAEAVASPESPSPENDSKADAPTGAAPAPTSAPGPDAGLERFVAREVALREREKAIEDKERAVSALEARIKALESRQLPEDLESEIYSGALFERLGIDQDQVVRASLARRMGEKAPPQLKADLEASAKDLAYRREIQAIKAELAAAKQEKASQEFYQKVVRDARAYIDGTDYHTAAPTVKAVAAKNKERVYNEVMDVITRDAQAKARAGGGDLISFEEAVKQVESRWKDLVALTPSSEHVAPKTQAGEAPKPATQPKATTGTVTPPNRPLAPWLQPREELEDVGLKSAIAEYRRLEKGV